MKYFLKVLLIFILILVVALGALLGWLSATEYRPAEVESLPINVSGEGRALPYEFSVLS